MNIAFLLDSLEIGGTELNAARTLEALGRRGIHVTVIHYRPDGPLRRRIEEAGHELIHIPTSSLYSPRTLRSVTAIRNILVSRRVSVVHAQDIYSNILGVLAGRVLTRLPVLTSRRWKDAVPRPALVPLNAWAHRRSTLVLPNSAELTDSLLKEGVSSDRIVVHENFIDDSALVPLDTDARSSWRSALGIPDTALVIGCVARLSPVKRHDRLLDAFARVLRELPDARLVLVGDGPARPSLETHAQRLSVAHRVIFTGTLPHTPLPQQLFDIGTLTSENEGFPNSLVEASACGVPLVATRVGGVTDVLQEGLTGFGVAPGDGTGLVAALLRLARDPALRERMGVRGHEVASKRFAETAAIDRLIGIYASVTSTRPPSA